MIVSYRRIGEVKNMADGIYEIEWESGEVEAIPLEKAPKLKNYRVGQAFETQATYAGKDLETLLRLTKILQCEPIHHMTEEEGKKLWDSLGTTADK